MHKIAPNLKKKKKSYLHLTKWYVDVTLTCKLQKLASSDVR